MNMKAWVVTALLASLAGHATARSVAPQSPEQSLCRQESVLVAHVVDARSHDCGEQDDGINCWIHYVGVTAQIDEVLAPSSGDLHVGDLIRVGFGVTKPVKLGGQLRWAENSGMLKFPDE